MSSFVETKAMEQLTKSPMEFVEYPSQALGLGCGQAGACRCPGDLSPSAQGHQWVEVWRLRDDMGSFAKSGLPGTWSKGWQSFCHSSLWP